MRKNGEINNMEKTLLIEKIVAGGFGLSRKGGKIYLVKNAYPGEMIEISIEKEKKDLALCKTKRVIEPLPDRCTPPCEHFAECGGCDWMNVTYEKQLEYKASIFTDQMKHTAKLEIPKPAIVPTSPYHYRNKLEFVVSHGKLGYFKNKTNDFLPIKECLISSEKLSFLKSSVEKVLKDHTKFAINVDRVVLREAEKNMVIFVSKSKLTPPKIEEADNIVSLENQSRVVISGRQTVHKGKSFLKAKVNGIKYVIPAKSFFQVNYQGASEVAKIVKKYAKKGKRLLDLYCGVGFLSLQLADVYEKIVGLESSPISVKAARKNAKINGISNTNFILLKIQKWNSDKQFDTVVIDPPRAGIGSDVIQKIINVEPSKIIYVSCDVSTFARDAREFMKSSYLLERVTLVDMFPQTHHFEIVALLIPHQMERKLE